MSGGSPSLVRDSLDDVFRLLADPIEESERIIVQMAKVRRSEGQIEINFHYKISNYFEEKYG